MKLMVARCAVDLLMLPVLLAMRHFSRANPVNPLLFSQRRRHVLAKSFNRKQAGLYFRCWKVYALNF